MKFDLKFTDEEKTQYSKYIFPMLLPFLKQFNKEQMAEKKVEADIQGILRGSIYSGVLVSFFLMTVESSLFI